MLCAERAYRLLCFVQVQLLQAPEKRKPAAVVAEQELAVVAVDEPVYANTALRGSVKIVMK